MFEARRVPVQDSRLVEIAELTVYLALPESSLRWLASATLSKIGGSQVEGALKALLEEDISEELRDEAERIITGLYRE